MAYNGKDIQEQLNKHGYNLAVDGIVGPKTTAAIKDFQTKNGLQVDGIVGTNTWGALTKANTTTTPTTTTGSTTTQTAPAQAEIKAPTWDFTQSAEAKQNWDNYNQFLTTQKPGEYNKTWLDTLGDTINQIMNREKFSYDLNGDALYQQYKDQYTTQGKMAMMDTMGQAQAMTGGYGNSYAQSVGQQAYQGYLQQLNDKVPELYQLALDQYNQEGQDLYNKAGLLGQMDDREYGRNQDELNNYYKELGVLFDNAKYMSETEYNQALQDFNIEYGAYRDAVADKQHEDTFAYTKERDAVADKKYEDTFTYQKEQDAITNAWKQKEFDEAVRQFNNTHSLNVAKQGLAGGDNDGTGDYYTANPGWDEEKIKKFQKAHGLTEDGIWGPKTAAEYDKDSTWTGDPDPIPDPTAADFADFDAGEWESFFAHIRQTESKAEAQKTMDEYISKGIIPQKYVNAAAIGVRGGQMGH